MTLTQNIRCFNEISEQDIWYNTCTGGTWGTEDTISTANDLLFPTIGVDNNGGVHCVWRNVDNGKIQYSFNSSITVWSTPVDITDAYKDYYPNIEKNIFSGSTYIGIVYINKSLPSFYNVTFYSHQIPEFPTLSLPIVTTSMIMLVIYETKKARK